MTQERINKLFETDLGQQLNELYVTFDDQVFIRYRDAESYLNEHGYVAEGNIELWYSKY
jgi:hypothetical protein